MSTIIASVLFVCINPTWLGCGAVQAVDYGTAEACQTALSSMRVGLNGQNIVGGDGKGIVALCRPK